MKFHSLAAAAALFGAVSGEAGSRDADMATLSERRIADLAEFPDPPWFDKIQSWVDSQKEDGTWSDVNYLSGCPARMNLPQARLDAGNG